VVKVAREASALEIMQHDLPQAIEDIDSLSRTLSILRQLSDKQQQLALSRPGIEEEIKEGAILACEAAHVYLADSLCS
jgi:hypothetical protein